MYNSFLIQAARPTIQLLGTYNSNSIMIPHGAKNFLGKLFSITMKKEALAVSGVSTHTPANFAA